MPKILCFALLLFAGNLAAQRQILEEASARKYIITHHISSVKTTQRIVHPDGASNDTTDFEREYDKDYDINYYDSAGFLKRNLHVDGGRDFITTFYYDTNGLLVTDTNMCAECPTMYVEQYTYDAEGRLKKYTKVSHDSAWRALMLKDEPDAKFGCVDEIVNYSYKGNNVKVETDACGEKNHYSYRENYNDTGAYVSRDMLTVFGLSNKGSTCFYDDQQRLTRMELYDKDGICWYQICLFYNAKGLPDHTQSINGKAGTPQSISEEYYQYTFSQ
ncbi:MAG TPA: hypothetical protein VL651_01355 [Bacteroidia bacterium]|jgi:hypothetical protein|nr:hypothetical protein [Bacteroidia bacterium]